MKMKIIQSILILFVLIMFLSISCKKEEPKPEGIAVDDLYGSWVFRTLEFNGNTYQGCDSVLNKIYDFVTLAFCCVQWDVWANASSMILYTSCVDNGDQPNWQKNYHFTLEDSVINCDGELKFKIVSLDSFQNIRQLKTKLIYSSIPDVTLSGIYTLWKTPY